MMQETVVIHQAHGSKQVWHDRWNRREKEWASTRELKIEGGVTEQHDQITGDRRYKPKKKHTHHDQPR